MYSILFDFVFIEKCHITYIICHLGLLDLNIIDNILLRIQRELQNTARNINTPVELFHAIHDLWISYQQQYIQNLYNLISWRIMAVILSKGCLTKY